MDHHLEAVAKLYSVLHFFFSLIKQYQPQAAFWFVAVLKWEEFEALACSLISLFSPLHPHRHPPQDTKGCQAEFRVKRLIATGKKYIMVSPGPRSL
jgi:hypothetical protein